MRNKVLKGILLVVTLLSFSSFFFKEEAQAGACCSGYRDGCVASGNSCLFYWGCNANTYASPPIWCWMNLYYTGVCDCGTYWTGWIFDGTCPCSSCGNCCYPVACQGCTPSAPYGYSASYTGSNITTTGTCTGNNGCGSSCTISKTFYRICYPVACQGCTPSAPSGYSASYTGSSDTTTATCTGNNGCGGSCTKYQTFWRICTPVACQGCTPATPAGYTPTNNGCPITTTNTCTGNNGCGSSCSISKTFWFVETNVALPAPARIDLRVQDSSYRLSTDPGNPTTVRMACNSDVDMTLPAISVPSTASSRGYALRANNYGVNDEWIAYNCTRNEDFCREGTSNIQAFLPSALTVPQVLKESAKGKIDGLYYTVDKCDSDKKYSLAIAGYYKVETNVPPSAPSSVTVLVDDQPYVLSTDVANPTVIKYPSTANNVKTSTPVIGLPSTASSLGYTFEANNYGLDSEWTRWGSCASPYSEDYCSEGIANTQNFTPSAMSISGVLKEGAKGLITGKYYTLNRCGANKVYSEGINAYYKVDNLPIIPPEDPGCSMLPDQQCTKEEFLPELGLEESTSTKGCKSEDYTGIEVNNPLKIRVGSSDQDGVDEIKGSIVWLSKSNTTPALPQIVGTYISTSTDEIGVMILQNNNSWSNTPFLYAINSDNTWALIADNTLRNSSLDPIARVSDIVVTQGGQIVTFEFKLELIPNSTSNPSGVYNFKSIVLDQYMLLSDGRVDQSSMKRYFNWGIDLVAPSMTDLSQTILGPQELYLNWSIDGTQSNITDVVINGYRDNYLVNDVIRLVNPTGFGNITLGDIPSESEIGLLTDTNSWIYSNINSNPYINSNSTKVNIGLNEGGIISMYVTAFDQGCNDNLRAHNIDLIPWIATKGGVMYSQGSFGSGAKDVSGVTGLTLRNILKEELDTGTELISSRKDIVNNLIHPELKAVRAINTYDSNDKKNYWFDYLKNKLEVQRVNLTDFVIGVGDTKVSQKCSGDNCLMYSQENIEIPSGYTCDKNTLFMSEKDIIINPDLYTSGDGVKGCIFLAKNNIEIRDGSYKSSSGMVKYDYIDGFLIAENQILIKTADVAEVVRDGLEVYGGLVAFGKDLVDISAVQVERNLRLFSYSHPTLVIAWDVRFAKLSEVFFGVESAIYKQEVGFKAY